MSNFLLRQVEYNNIQEEMASVEFDYSSRDYINLPNANIQKNTYSTYARGIVSTSTDEKLEEYNKLFS